MNRFLTSVCILLLAAGSVNAQSAQVKNAAKSTFKLTAYDSNGNATSSTCGVFVTADGEAIGSWSALSSAASAVVTDFNGKTYPVQKLIGANEIYDVCRFKVGTQKAKAATLAKALMPKDSKLWLVGSELKKPTAAQYEIERQETFMDKYGYYVLAFRDSQGIPGSAMVNANGELVGLFQSAPSAVDARYAAQLKFDALTINNPLYTGSGIRLQLPADKKDAQLMVMFAADKGDSAKYAGYISDYISQFPHDVDGYSMDALRRVNYGDYAGADSQMQTALKQATNKAEAHSEYSRVMYQKLVYSNNSLYNDWTLDRAYNEAEKAYKLDAQPAYQHRMAQILYTKGEYQKAYDMFDALTKTPICNSEIFFEAAQCKTQLGAPNEQVLVLLDSCVARCPQPLTTISAPYILTRGHLRDAMKDYRGALADYNTYDTLMLGRASADFYYTRYTCEVNLRQYQQALNDIAHAAIVAQPDMRPPYLAELASLQLRVNKFEDAVKTADLCLNLDPKSTDALVIKGVALNALKRKAEAIECLKKAAELGDKRGDEFIKKYSGK